jgi:hypothetical protein
VTRIRVSSLTLRWILAATLTAAPLLAEQSAQTALPVAAHRPIVQVLDENNTPLVGDNILFSLANPSQEATTANQERTATELGAPREPAPAPGDKKAEPGGKTWSDVIVAALIVGGVVALILLLHGGDKKPAVSTAPGPKTSTGTVLAPGTPGVTAPH